MKTAELIPPSSCSPPRWDLSGMTYGRLIVQRLAGFSKGLVAYWECSCDCGKTTVAKGINLTTAITQSCGCWHQEITSKINFIHGMCKSSTYKSWIELRARCMDEKNDAYHNYGGRGITVCDRWRESFENFLADMGEKPSRKYSIDRKNNNGNYEKDNCRWATAIQQGNNTRSNVRITMDGIEDTLKNHARRIGIKYCTFYSRFRRGLYQQPT